ncbi:MAG: hypothetical protein COT90_01805 [Candidatus Diapherotrites archaeon CG10_big_fil_rev_8_21_14_0_10_31_34]|nr:MAG: hypothetical protein COT90_01805 [Candidatus Diapherotrites archaeon CG10_big_fil_rev_8_21_14_0_10_31_34]
MEKKQRLQIRLSKLFNQISNALFFSRSRFIGIAKGDRLIAYAYYSGKDKSCYIDYIETKTSPSFRKKYGVTPAQYLMERFVRKGVRKFKYIFKHKPGKTMVVRLKKEGLIKKRRMRLIYEVTQLGIQQANSRKKLIKEPVILKKPPKVL